jgi:CMP-N-acetylneuraminic acid synthetase
MKVVAIIPARFGSKGLPGKNIKNFLGHPLIAWTISAALKSRIIQDVIVTTDDENIASIAKSYGASIPFLRPKKYAGDRSPIFDTIKYTLENLKTSYDIVVLLEPTSPLRSINDIDDALTKFIKNYENFDSLVSVGEVFLENPDICKTLDGDFIKPFLNTARGGIYQRQNYKKAYFPYGVVYMSKISNFLQSKTFYQNKTGYIQIQKWQCFEIDDTLDFFICEKVADKFNLSGTLIHDKVSASK